MRKLLDVALDPESVSKKSIDHQMGLATFLLPLYTEIVSYVALAVVVVSPLAAIALLYFHFALFAPVLLISCFLVFGIRLFELLTRTLSRPSQELVEFKYFASAALGAMFCSLCIGVAEIVRYERLSASPRDSSILLASFALLLLSLFLFSFLSKIILPFYLARARAVGLFRTYDEMIEYYDTNPPQNPDDSYAHVMGVDFWKWPDDLSSLEPIMFREEQLEQREGSL